MFNHIHLLTEIYVGFVTYFISVFSTINLIRETIMRKPLPPTQCKAKNKNHLIQQGFSLFIHIYKIHLYFYTSYL